MRKFTLQPTADDCFRIVYDPADRGPGFEQALTKASRQETEGDIEGACNTRFRAVQYLMELLPEEEQAILDWEDAASRSALTLVNLSAIDHFLASDFEMCAAMFETLLDLDPEDHQEAVKRLAYCYVALEEYELFDEAAADIGDKDPEAAILRLWSAFRRTGGVPQQEAARFRKDFPAWEAELASAEHPVTPEYLTDLESPRPSRETLARQWWIETEHLWAQFPGFIEALR